ncbi:MAG: hypothetical protein OEW39_01420 [Deltaproteobacteria bacterium]|nr:hypothetical protein [Deltaproteobacteria bacterium]
MAGGVRRIAAHPGSIAAGEAVGQWANGAMGVEKAHGLVYNTLWKMP